MSSATASCVSAIVDSRLELSQARVIPEAIVSTKLWPDKKNLRDSNKDRTVFHDSSLDASLVVAS